MTSNLPEPATESLGAAIIELDRARLPWPARWVLRDGTRAYSLIADQVARRVEDRVVARVREEATHETNLAWGRIIDGHAANERAEAEALEFAPYSGTTAAVCAKCGRRNGTKDRYHAASPSGLVSDFLGRKCRACGFEWRERCADAPQAQNGPQSDGTGPGDATDAEAANEAHSTPKETGAGLSPAERAGDGHPDGPESPQSHAEAPGRENTRDDGPEPASVALVPAVTASGGFGDGNPDATAADR